MSPLRKLKYKCEEFSQGEDIIKILVILSYEISIEL